MSTAVMPDSRSIGALARIETIRLARHPMFVIGVVASTFFLATELRTDFDYYNIAIDPAFFVGMFSMAAMFRLTRSMQRTEEALGSAPSSQRDRVLALCLASWLPAVVGLLSFAAILTFMHGSEPHAYGAWSQADRVAIFFGEVVIACIGGPLLGVAAGRWLTFPGGVVVPFVAILFYVLLGEGLTFSAKSNVLANLVRLTSPWTQFTSVESGPTRLELETWRGSPWWYLGWLVSLCVLAVLGALLKGAEGEERRRIIRTGAVVGTVGLVCVALAWLLGPDHAYLYSPKGVKEI